MKQTLGLAAGAALIIGMTYGALNLSAENENHKMLVCHVTGNGTAHVIDIDKHAWPAHHAHGDSMDVPAGSRPGEPCVVTPPQPAPPPPPDQPPVVLK